MSLIKWTERMKQPKDFKNLMLSGYSPTDIDAIYDVNGQRYIIIELKLKDAPMPEGQRRALKYLADNLVKAGCDVCLMVAEHNNPVTEPIDVGNAIITKCATADGGEKTDKKYIGWSAIDACNDFLGFDKK